MFSLQGMLIYGTHQLYYGKNISHKGNFYISPNFGIVLKDYLSMNDFDVVLAKNGMEGFEKFKKDHFDVCILDVMMPYKDGFTLAREIRDKDENIPIIFLTAKTMKEDVLKGYKAGADDYLHKPFDSEVLLMKLKAILQRKSSNNLADSKQFEFTFGNFHLNSKLRFLKYKDEEAIKFLRELLEK